jgi:hypothetical protein
VLPTRSVSTEIYVTRHTCSCHAIRESKRPDRDPEGSACCPCNGVPAEGGGASGDVMGYTVRVVSA